MDSCTNLQCCSVPLNFHQERRRKTDHERSNFPLHHMRRFSTSSVVFVCVVSLLFLCCYPVSVSCISLQFSNISEHALGSPFFIFGKTNFAITGEVVRAFPEDGCAPLSAVSASDGSDYFANKIVWMEPLHCSIESKIFNCQAVQCLAIISSSISRVPGNEMWTQWDINVTPELSPGENKVLQEKDLESLIHIPFVHVGREDADVIRKLLLAKDGALRDHDHIALINMSLMAERSGLAAESAKGELGLMVATLYDYSPESINQWDDVFTSFNFLFLFQVLLTFIHGFSFALASNKWLAYYRKSNGQTDNSSLTREAKVKQREKNRRRWMRQQQQRRFPGPPYQPREIRMPQEIAEPNSGIREQSVAKNEKDNDDPEQMITEHHEQHEQTIEMSLMQPPGNRNSNDFVQVPTHEDTVTMDMNAMEENQANFSQPASPAKHQHTEIEMADYRYSMARVKDSNASSWSECVPPHTRSAPASACHVHGRVKIDALADAQAEVVAIHYTHDSDEKFPAIVADKRSDAVTFDDIESRSRRSTVNTRKALIRPARYNPQHAASDRDDTLTNNPDAGHDNGAAPAGAGTADSASANDNANGSPALGTSFSYIPLVILSLEMFAMFERALYCCLDPLGARHFIPYSIRRFLLTLSIPFTFSANLLLIFFWYETLARYGELTMHMMKSKYKKTKSTLQQWSANPIPASEQAMLAEEDEEDRDDRRDTFNLNLFPSSPSSLQFLTHFRLPFFCTCVTLFLCDFTFALLDVLYVSDLIFLPIVEIVYSICSIVFLASVVYVAIYLFHHFHFAAEKEKSYLKLLCVTSEKEQQEIFEANRKAAFEQIFTSSPTAGDANKEAAKENLFRELTLLNMQQMRSFAITVETAIRNQMRKIDANKNKKMHRLKSFVAFVGMGMIAFMIGNALSPFLLPWMDSPVMTVARQWIIYVAMWMLGTAHILCF